MTTAQQRLAKLVEWVVASSQDRMAPLGKDRIVYGPYAVFVPQDLTLPPSPTFAPELLPLWLSAQQAIPGIPAYTQAAPLSRGRLDSRLRHLAWKWQDRWFQGALLGLTDPAEPLQSVLDRQLPDLDLSTHPALFAPLWDLDAGTRTFLERLLPLVTP